MEKKNEITDIKDIFDLDAKIDRKIIVKFLYRYQCNNEKSLKFCIMMEELVQFTTGIDGEFIRNFIIAENAFNIGCKPTEDLYEPLLYLSKIKPEYRKKFWKIMEKHEFIDIPLMEKEIKKLDLKWLEIEALYLDSDVADTINQITCYLYDDDSAFSIRELMYYLDKARAYTDYQMNSLYYYLNIYDKIHSEYKKRNSNANRSFWG